MAAWTAGPRGSRRSNFRGLSARLRRVSCDSSNERAAREIVPNSRATLVSGLGSARTQRRLHMKAFSSLAMFASLLILASCGDGGGGGGGAPASKSPFGTATGPAVEATIGPAGGALGSGDGKVTVSIPAGALAADTTISIQPFTNTAPGGRGLSYRFAPSGVVFSAPVQITFSFTDADLIGSRDRKSTRLNSSH